MSSTSRKTIRVGSRKSELALIQTKHVIARLQQLHPDKEFEIHTMSTMGDRVLNISLPKIGEKSLFTRDLEDALRSGGVDFVVHSLKDLPTTLPTGMAIGAVLEREDARDALVLNPNYKQYTLSTLPRGSIIGTSSLRRTAQLRRQYPHLSVCDVRGNINTRLAKLDAGNSHYAGIILANAGLMRMGWTQRINQVLEPTELLYAVGQGALAVECRCNDVGILGMLEQLMCRRTTCRILAERSFLKMLGGGCSAPVAVCSHWNESENDDTNLALMGAVWSLDGSIEISDKMLCSLKVDSTTTEKQPKLGIRSQQCEEGVEANELLRPKRSGNNASVNAEFSPRHYALIVDDTSAERFATSYDMKQLISKHIDLAKKCPVLCKATDVFNKGAGDAAGHFERHCPLQIDVGQDFMGQCPFVTKECKAFADDLEHNKPSTSICSHPPIPPDNGVGDGVKSTTATEIAHGKCPFLQRTVALFDYADEQKPLPQKVQPFVTENIESLYCGLYKHACNSSDLFERCTELGQLLAKKLINQGALEVMKRAQAEIHNKN